MNTAGIAEALSRAVVGGLVTHWDHDARTDLWNVETADGHAYAFPQVEAAAFAAAVFAAEHVVGVRS